MSTEGPNRGDRSFQAFLGVAVWIIAIALLLCLVIGFAWYLIA